MRGTSEKKEAKIKFLKDNEIIIREIFENGFTQNNPLFLSLVNELRGKTYSFNTVPEQIYRNLYNVAIKDIGWKF